MHDAVIARLSAQVSALKTVAGTAEFAGAETAPKQLPACYVIPLVEKASGNDLETGVEQHVVVRFGVAIAIRNVKDARGQAGQAALKTVRDAISAALLGWEPATGYDPVLFGSGQLIKLGNSVLWWQDEFVTGYYRRT